MTGEPVVTEQRLAEIRARWDYPGWGPQAKEDVAWLLARLSTLEAAASQAAENIEGDLFLYGIDSLELPKFFDSMRTEKDRLRSALASGEAQSE